MTEQLTIPEPLIEAILEGRCVAFVGAGFSAAARLPGWRQLLQCVAEELPQLGATAEAQYRQVMRLVGPDATPGAKEYEQAAQLLQDSLKPGPFVAAVRRLLVRDDHDAINAAMAARLRWLRQIPFRAILTTNFDSLLDGDGPGSEAYWRLLRDPAPRWWDQAFDPDRAEGTGGAPVLKLHGDVRSDDIVFTRRDYRKLVYQRSGLLPFLHGLAASNTFLYLGTSFEDAYLNELRSQVLALVDYQEVAAPTAYAVMPDQGEVVCDWFNKHEGIEILSYSTQDDPAHRGFDDRLRAIWERTAILPRFGALLKGRRILWLDPNRDNNAEGVAFLQRVAGESGGETEVIEVDTVERALYVAASSAAPVDLIITRWGHDDRTAVRLFDGLRARAARPPVIVFADPYHADANKPAALRLGAYAFCARWETLFRTIERLLRPGRETC